LTAAGCERVFQEAISGTRADRLRVPMKSPGYTERFPRTVPI